MVRRAARGTDRRNRRHAILWWGVGAVGVALGAIAVATLTGPHAGGQEIVVYKTASCGCCKQWVAHLEDYGFRVDVSDLVDLRPVRAELGVPEALTSCHSAEVSGYAVEGHVPAPTLIRLLDARPAVAGVAVPGMPGGAPGMENAPRVPYNVVVFDRAGAMSVYERH